jgi:hypothetical protein
MPKLNKYSFFDECYKVNVYLVWGCDENELNSYTVPKGFDALNPALDFFGACLSSENGYCVYVKKKDICTLHHECIHLASMILTGVGISVGADSNEAVCYLSEMYFRKFVDKMGFKGV